ncbi:hypothetical protein HY612_01630 [Candidatus Roizmanbacteria bacterium]|nr:hypothetical protein [Candidatus Roizmanbacteria bacterium]
MTFDSTTERKTTRLPILLWTQKGPVTLETPALERVRNDPDLLSQFGPTQEIIRYKSNFIEGWLRNKIIGVFADRLAQARADNKLDTQTITSEEIRFNTIYSATGNPWAVLPDDFPDILTDAMLVEMFFPSFVGELKPIEFRSMYAAYHSDKQRKMYIPTEIDSIYFEYEDIDISDERPGLSEVRSKLAYIPEEARKDLIKTDPRIFPPLIKHKIFPFTTKAMNFAQKYFYPEIRQAGTEFSKN